MVVVVPIKYGSVPTAGYLNLVVIDLGGPLAPERLRSDQKSYPGNRPLNLATQQLRTPTFVFDLSVVTSSPSLRFEFSHPRPCHTCMLHPQWALQAAICIRQQPEASGKR